MIVKIAGTATGVPHEADGCYIVSYDPEPHITGGGYNGGHLVTTPNRAEATRFTHEQASDLWRSGPSCACHRLRPDGKRNRPLTAFTVLIQPDEEPA
jgi:hypothetical protein